MGRPQIKSIDVELIRRLREVGLNWRTIARRYYSQTKQDIIFVITFAKIKLFTALWTDDRLTT